MQALIRSPAERFSAATAVDVRLERAADRPAAAPPPVH